MKTFKYIVVFSFFIVLYCAIWFVPKLHIKALLFKHNIAKMFKIKGGNEHPPDDIVIKKIRYIGSNEFEIFTFEDRFLSVVLPYNPILVVSKQIASDSVIADISGNYFGKVTNLKDYLERK